MSTKTLRSALQLILALMFAVISFLPMANPVRAQEQNRRIEWSVRWEQPLVAGGEIKQTTTIAKADPSLEVYESVFYRYLRSGGGITKTLTAEGITSNKSAGNYLYAVESINYYTHLGGKSFMGSTYNGACQRPGPELRITRTTTPGLSWVGFSNYTDREVEVTIVDNNVISSQTAMTTTVINQPVGDIGEIRVKNLDGTICAYLWWNWKNLEPAVTLKAVPTEGVIGTGNVLEISIEDVQTPLTDYQFVLEFDPQVIGCFEAKKEGTLSADWNVHYDPKVEGQVTVGGYAGNPITSDGVLIKLTYCGKKTGYSFLSLHENDIVINDSKIPVIPVHSLVQIGTYEARGRALYGNGSPIPSLDVNLSGASTDQTETDTLGDFVLHAAHAGEHTIGFSNSRFEGIHQALAPSDPAKILRCALDATVTCPEIASDVNRKNGINVHDAYLTAQGLLGNFPEESHVGEWACDLPFHFGNITTDIFGVNTTCWIIGDATESWYYEPVVMASSVPTVIFGEKTWEGDNVVIPVTIQHPSIDGAMFTLGVENGEIVEVTSSDRSIDNNGNQYLIYGSQITDEITFLVKVKKSSDARLVVNNLQVNEQPVMQGEIASVDIIGDPPVIAYPEVILLPLLNR